MINLIKQLLDWIYYESCYFCNKKSETGLICKNCLDKIKLNNINPIKTINNINIYSSSLYTGDLRKLIKGLKYHNKKKLAKPLAEMLYNFWQKLDISDKEFEIVPLPLYISRQRKRGFNHTKLLADEFSKLTGYKINEKIVKRIKNTKPQYKLSRAERIENLKDAFEVDIKEYSGKNLLLLDDICTSGTTLKELTSVFQENNINNLYAIVIANPVN